MLLAGVTALGGGGNQASPGDQAGVQSQTLSPVANVTVDITSILFVIVENVVTSKAVSKGIKANDILCVWWTKWR